MASKTLYTVSFTTGRTATRNSTRAYGAVVVRVDRSVESVRKMYGGMWDSAKWQDAKARKLADLEAHGWTGSVRSFSRDLGLALRERDRAAAKDRDGCEYYAIELTDGTVTFDLGLPAPVEAAPVEAAPVEAAPVEEDSRTARDYFRMGRKDLVALQTAGARAELIRRKRCPDTGKRVRAAA